jgi:hypothetical protein
MSDASESGRRPEGIPPDKPATCGRIDIRDTGTDEGPSEDREAAVASSIRDKFVRVNKELWLLLGILAIAGAMNYLVTAKRMIIGFYALPTLFSAYFYGRRHAVLTAFASVFFIGLMAYFNPLFLGGSGGIHGVEYDLIIWGGTLVLTAYAMGTLHEREKMRIAELRHTYQGLLIILRQLVCNDNSSENHAQRVSFYATTIAEQRGLEPQRIEDVRAAALLHDIAGLESSRDLLRRATQLTLGDSASNGRRGATASRTESVEGPIHRIVPIILSCRQSFDSRGDALVENEVVPIEARVIKVADAYDTLITGGPGRTAVTPLEAKMVIDRASGSEFDPTVVHAFKRAFIKGKLELPELIGQQSGP